MKIVMTGATSFIGLALTRELSKRGIEICALVRPQSQARGELSALSHVTLIDGSLDMLPALPEKAGGNADIFVHMGWDGSGSANRTKTELQRKNLEYSRLAMEVARSLGCRRFVFTGSQAEYGRTERTLEDGRNGSIDQAPLMTEESPCAPLTEYGRIKLQAGELGEKLCKEWEMDFVHARIFSVYGPGDHPWTLAESCLRTFTQGGHIDLSECLQMWNFLYIADAAKALTALILCEKMLAEYGSIYNIAADRSDTKPLRWFVETMYELSPKKGTFSYGTRDPNAEGPINLVPDISKIIRVTGWRPEITFEDGVKQYLHYLTEGKIK